MANEDILGGLRSALTRGYSLEEAMLSFYNAGYKREDIEDAARTLQTQAPIQNLAVQPPQVLPQRQAFEKKPRQQIPQPAPTPVVAPPVQPVQIQKPVEKKIEPIQVKQIAPPRPTNQVSSYTSYGSRLRTITTILVILLVVLLGILGLIFAFKQQIIQFFNNLF